MKTLTRSFASAAAVAIFASYASANPIDTDNDGVLDDDDMCPNQPGYGWNDGCPGVRVTGTRDDFWLVECPDGSEVSIWTQCSGFADWTRWHAKYHDADTGDWLYTDTTETTTETAEPEGSSEEDELTSIERYEQAVGFCIQNLPTIGVGSPPLDAGHCAYFAAGYAFDFCDNQHMAPAEGALLGCGFWAKKRLLKRACLAVEGAIISAQTWICD